MEKSRCWVEISKEAVRTNLKNMIEYLDGRSKVIAVVKADCYGHGRDPIVKEMLDAGINDFAVATLNEALSLREIVRSDSSILVLGYVEKENWLIAHEKNIVMTVCNYVHGMQLAEFAREKGIVLNVEVKVDTGMNRIGTRFDCDERLIKDIYGNGNLHINGTFSHLCVADSFSEEDREFTMCQKERFDAFLKKVTEMGLSYGRSHLCASSGIMNYPKFKYDYVRPGFIYLGYDVGEVKQPIVRQRVLKWLTRIEMIKDTVSGDGISYGQTYHCDRNSRIATLSVGYADGYPRSLSNKGYVLVRGQKAPIVGRICMDQMMIDVSDIEDVKAEDIVTLIGRDGENEITIEEFSQMAGTIADEIACNINSRVIRYFE